MNRAELISAIGKNLDALLDFIGSQTEEALNRKTGEKWSIGENAVHLNKSISPVNMAMGLPKFTFYFFGKVSFSRSYDEIIGIYKAELEKGAQASRAYIPQGTETYSPVSLTASLRNSYSTYMHTLENWEEEDLDTYRLPHPIIGKITRPPPEIR